MVKDKEKRLFERIDLRNLNGSVEIKESTKTINILNVSEEGMCISGAEIPVGTVIRLDIDAPENQQNISLYCKSMWASKSNPPNRKTGLLLLNTNKILFKKDLVSFEKLIESARK